MTRRPSYRDLEPGEELALIQRYQAGDSAAGGLLLEAHGGVIYNLARRYFHTGLDREDVKQEAKIGFLEGVKRFDPTENVKLATYAMWWVWNHLQIAVRDTSKLIRLPRKVRDVLLKSALRGEQAPEAPGAGSVPSAEVARADSTVWMVAHRPVSLDDVNPHTRDSLGDRLPSHELTPEEQLAELEERAAVAKALAELVEELPSALGRDTIRRRFLAEEPETLQAIATTRGCTREYVRQVEAKSMGLLRRRATARGLGAA